MHARILENGIIRKTSLGADVKAAHEAGLTLWVDLEQKNDETQALLEQTFGIHPLVIEDIWSERTSPKLDDMEGYLYILVHGVTAGSGAKDLTLLELDIVLGPTWVITHDSGQCVSAEVGAECDRSPRLLAKGAAWLAHALLDKLVDRYVPIVDEFDESIEALQLEVIEKAGTPKGRDLLGRIFKMRRTLQSLRRVAVHQREMLLRLSRSEFELIPKETVPFFRDVYDHFVRVNDMAESQRELVTSALEAYLSVQSNRMNEIMKTLTLISTVMLPLTFIAGVYGMNFKVMPELEWVHGYPYALTLMLVVGLGIVLFFRHRRWL